MKWIGSSWTLSKIELNMCLGSLVFRKSPFLSCFIPAAKWRWPLLRELFVNIKRKTGAWHQSELQDDRHYWIQDSACLLIENKTKARLHTNTSPGSDKSERSQGWSHSCDVENDMLGFWQKLILTPLSTLTLTTPCKRTTFCIYYPLNTHTFSAQEWILLFSKIMFADSQKLLYKALTLWSWWKFYRVTNRVCP